VFRYSPATGHLYLHFKPCDEPTVLSAQGAIEGSLECAAGRGQSCADASSRPRPSLLIAGEYRLNFWGSYPKMTMAGRPPSGRDRDNERSDSSRGLMHDLTRPGNHSPNAEERFSVCVTRYARGTSRPNQSQPVGYSEKDILCYCQVDGIFTVFGTRIGITSVFEPQRISESLVWILPVPFRGLTASRCQTVETC
jgi:hypothetical protein